MPGYSLLDAGNFAKLERVGDFILKRPAPAAVWPPFKGSSDWQKFDAEFVRKSDGKGTWQIRNPKLNKAFTIAMDNLHIAIRLTDFGHLGFFAEHAIFWEHLQHQIKTLTTSSQECRVLNLFAYTGTASLICARTGASVTHVDASKTSVNWAKENASLSSMATTKIRWLVEDARKFVAREVRRNATYEGVILDPPTYGRGSKGEVWQIERDLGPLLSDISKLLSKNFRFVLLSSHSPGYTPLALENLLKVYMPEKIKGAHMEAKELVIAPKHSPLLLPSGAGCFLQAQTQ